MIFPIPPNLYCVPAALVAITGAPLDAVVLPALNRAGANPTLLDDPGPTTMRVAEEALSLMSYRVLRPREPLHGSLLTHAREWSSKEHPVLASTRHHALVIWRGKVYDTFVPGGCEAETHPHARKRLTHAAMIVRR